MIGELRSLAYDGSKYKAWICRDRHLGRKGSGCRIRLIREESQLAGLSEQPGCELTEESNALLDRVDVRENDLEIRLRSGPVSEKQPFSFFTCKTSLD